MIDATDSVISGPETDDFLDVDLVTLRGFGLATELRSGRSDWHQHNKHQLLYASRGTLRLVTARGQWLLAVGRGAWIAAGVEHLVDIPHGASLRTVYVSPSLPGAPQAACAVFGVTALAREMILHAMRWDATRDPDDATAEAFFLALVHLCAEWVGSEHQYALPVTRKPALSRAIQHALTHLDTATIEDAARAAHVSPRTLSRRFSAELGMTWRAFLHNARMLHAMQLLADPDAAVTTVSLDVGFDSLSAFSQAFKKFCGESPTAYQRRASRGDDPL